MMSVFNAENFVQEGDNVLIAPAGFGKTHSICECVKFAVGKHLILTHTQAGVASIKEKLLKNGIDKDKYRVETIHSFSQAYVTAYCTEDEIPEENLSEYFQFVIDKAAEIFSLNAVKDIIKNSYSGLLVDEYQDCTMDQHRVILELANILKTHLFGDPLQGIFGWAGELVDLTDPSKMGRFNKFYKLNTPQRWIRSGNEELGKELLKIRENLEKKLEINLTDFSYIEYKKGEYLAHRSYIFNCLIENKSVLILHPDSMNIEPRRNFVAAFKNIPLLIESFDGRDFIKYAKQLDRAGLTAIELIHEFISHEFANLSNWYDKGNKRFRKKKDVKDEVKLRSVKLIIDELSSDFSLLKLKRLIFEIKKLKGVNCSRVDLLNSIGSALEMAHSGNITVSEAMKRHRNVHRRVGRKVDGKCVGTTLLTKGLEFDVVIILNAEAFNDLKNFYVAISRGTKRLIIFSNSDKLTPYPRTR